MAITVVSVQIFDPSLPLTTHTYNKATRKRKPKLAYNTVTKPDDKISIWITNHWVTAKKWTL